MKWLISLLLIFCFAVAAWVIYHSPKLVTQAPQINQPLSTQSNPLQISELRTRSYPGSGLKIEQALSDGSNYHQYIASYLSDG